MERLKDILEAIIKKLKYIYKEIMETIKA